MKIEKIYIGGWFQRTTLQLSEIYDFLRNASSVLDLDKRKLKRLHEQLGLVEVKFELNSLENVQFSTTYGVNVKIYEDGLIVLNHDTSKEEILLTDIKEVTDYYENKLSPALSYLFSLGAPIPKELSNIQTVYPYLIVLNHATKEDMIHLLEATEKEQYYEYSNESYEVLRGNKYYFVNNKTKSMDRVERYIEEQIFLREFKGQLHHYLNLHRIIWEKIADVKENVNIRGKEIVKYSGKIEMYAKTINLVEARINQMGTYLRTREKIAKSDEELQKFLDMIGYRYETLGNTLSYIQQLWGMTKNYVKSAGSLFQGLRQEVTSKSINNLTIVTSMGVGASLIGLFTATSVPSITGFGVIYFITLALFGYIVQKIMKKISNERKYHISDIDYDKNIGSKKM